MFIGTIIEETTYTRPSKIGKVHEYIRKRTVAQFRCDNCDSEFTRTLKQIDSKRLSNNYFHVCSECDAKKFAQRKGIERKKIWDMPASSNLPVGKY